MEKRRSVQRGRQKGKQNAKRKSKINMGRIAGAASVVVLVFAVVFGTAFYIYKTQHGIATKGLVEDTDDLLGDINLGKTSEEERSLLDDYELVRKMLMAQDMRDYPQVLLLKINEQNQAILDKLKEQTLVDMEASINNLAALIDQPNFAGDAGDLFYARGLLILNKQHRAPDTFAPGDRKITADAFARMQAAAKEQGVNLFDFSNYRSYHGQETLYNRYVAIDGEEAANRYSAKPGYSEHQTGYVMDIGGDNKGAWAETTFDNTREAKWLAENAPKYGFILRYPPGKEDITGYIYESWHFRYIGEIAEKVTASGKSLEEYLGLV